MLGYSNAGRSSPRLTCSGSNVEFDCTVDPMHNSLLEGKAIFVTSIIQVFGTTNRSPAAADQGLRLWLRVVRRSLIVLVLDWSCLTYFALLRAGLLIGWGNACGNDIQIR
jgi:hypothetical protein